MLMRQDMPITYWIWSSPCLLAPSNPELIRAVIRVAFYRVFKLQIEEIYADLGDGGLELSEVEIKDFVRKAASDTQRLSLKR